jgi:hypothetical protein
MKTSMNQRMLAALVTVQVFLVTVASAHPGPPGHTHADDWPFGLLPALGAVLFSLFLFKVVKKRS